MADYDANLIKPVQGLQNIAGLGLVKRRKERSNRRQLNEKRDEQDESSQDKEAEKKDRAKNTNDPDSHEIDYCA